MAREKFKHKRLTLDTLGLVEITNDIIKERNVHLQSYTCYNMYISIDIVGYNV